jgi:hypothetical protein
MCYQAAELHLSGQSETVEVRKREEQALDAVERKKTELHEATLMFKKVAEKALTARRVEVQADAEVRNSQVSDC